MTATTHIELASAGTEPSEELLPEAIGPAVSTDTRHIPLSFEVLGFSPGEAPYGPFVHAVETLANNEAPEFVAIGGAPERPIVAAKIAAELITPDKVTPVVSWETAPTRNRLKDTLRAYAAEGISQILIAPTQAQLEGKAMFETGAQPVDLLDMARQTDEFSRLGVVVRPEESPIRAQLGVGIGGEYERIATELSQADFALTQFVLETAPYTMLVKAMRERSVHTPITPGIALFTKPHRAVLRAQEASLTVPDQLVSINEQHKINRATDWEMRQASMHYSIQLGRNLLHFGAPGLHIDTPNEIRWLSELTNGLRQAA